MNEIIGFGHRFDEENAIEQAEFEHDTDKIGSIIYEIYISCERGQHRDQLRPYDFRKI